VGGDLNPWWQVGLPLALSLERLLFRVRVTGIHHVPLAGPAILAFNHVSVLDGPCLAIETAWRRRRESRFLVADEVFDHPPFGWILRRYEQIPIRRGGGDEGALDEAIATIRRGALAAIAPEGTVNADPGSLQRVRSGIARIALPTGAPVVPVGIWGTQRRWSKAGRHWGGPLRPRLAFAYGAPIVPSGDASERDDVDAFVGLLRKELERQVAEVRVLAGDPP
jgi:1-acyl-sn-glycerol-3-phosphate acyltransferase